MKKIKFLRYRFCILFVLATCTVLLNHSCEKVQPHLLKITNPFDFSTEIRSNDIDDCSPFGEDIIPGCVIAPSETKTFASEGTRGVISIDVHHTDLPYRDNRYTDSRYHENGGLVGEVSFRVRQSDGETYKWEVGFNKPVYDSKGDNVMDTGGDGGHNNGGGAGGGGSDGNGQVVFYSQANINECRSVEVTVFSSLEEYYGTATTPGGRGVLGTKTFTGVFPNQEATCSSANAAVFTFPPGRYYFIYTTKNCTIGGENRYAYQYFDIVKDECLKIRVSR